MRQIFRCAWAYLTLFIFPVTAQYTIGTIAGGVSADGMAATSRFITNPHIALDPSGNLYFVAPDESRVYKVGRIELHLGAASGHMLVLDEAHALPAGSTLKSGVFYWQPGPGFLGEYTMQFERPDGSTIPVRVRVAPKRY